MDCSDALVLYPSHLFAVSFLELSPEIVLDHYRGRFLKITYIYLLNALLHHYWFAFLKALRAANHSVY